MEKFFTWLITTVIIFAVAMFGAHLIVDGLHIPNISFGDLLLIGLGIDLIATAVRLTSD